MQRSHRTVTSTGCILTMLLPLSPFVVGVLYDGAKNNLLSGDRHRRAAELQRRCGWQCDQGFLFYTDGDAVNGILIAHHTSIQERRE